MSYILDALKKSQEERELGRVPTLASGPYLTADRPSKVSPWSIAAVVLAALAVLIALYAAMAPRHGDTLAPAPPGAATGPQGEAKNPPGADPAAAAPHAPPPPEAPAAPRSTEPPALARAAAPAARPEDSAPILDEAALREQVERFEAEQGPPQRQEPRAPPSAFAPGSGRPPSVPADLRRDILDFKQKALREAGKKERPSPKVAQGAVPEVSERPIAPPPPEPPQAPPAAGSPPPAPATAGPPSPSPAPAPDPATPGPAAVPPRSVGSPAATEGGSKLPQARLTVHVYSEEPAKRFVILNSQRVQEGDQTSDGFRVEEIRPDGAMLSFQGQRFFRAR